LAKMSASERQAAIERAANVSLGTRASELPSPARVGHLLRIFGQSDRDQIANANEEASVAQALALLNSPVSEILGQPQSQLQQDLTAAHSFPEKMELLYRSVFSRRPSRGERSLLEEAIRERGDSALADVTHA